MTGSLECLRTNETESKHQELSREDTSSQTSQSHHDSTDSQQPTPKVVTHSKKFHTVSSRRTRFSKVEQLPLQEYSISNKMHPSNRTRNNSVAPRTRLIPSGDQKLITSLNSNDQSNTEFQSSSFPPSISRSKLTQDSIILPHSQDRLSLKRPHENSSLHTNGSFIPVGTTLPYGYTSSQLPPLATSIAPLPLNSYYNGRFPIPPPVQTPQYLYSDQSQPVTPRYSNFTSLYHQPSQPPQYWKPIRKFPSKSNHAVQNPNQPVLKQNTLELTAISSKNEGNAYRSNSSKSTGINAPFNYTQNSRFARHITDSNSSTKSTQSSEHESSYDLGDSQISKDGEVANSSEPLKSISTEKVARVAKRSRNGCLTCRSRKRKCDENKPVCNECRRLRIKCIWMTKTQRQNKTKKHPYLLRVDETYNTEFGVIKVVRGKVDYKIEDGQIVQDGTSPT
ncbi:DEBR0S1_22144g1_1 [Brettanomyces bruxellensis]|uniref:DEBR0S1_22144g1_1 n=1 Tax=Dekkera bruxellensis TaxID=5007 RepID=A0A7D9GZB3_DEKBR|nr:DEBR0S1_22144g1_1 [Brettanomyces bruxellensis]